MKDIYYQIKILNSMTKDLWRIDKRKAEEINNYLGQIVKIIGLEIYLLDGSLNIKQDAAPSTSSLSHIYSSKPEETMLTDSLNIKQDAIIWKQEYIVSATNINEMEFITNNIKRLSKNIPDEVDDEARNLNKKIKLTLERINNNEDVRNLNDITNNVWKERSQTKKENKYMIKRKYLFIISYKKIKTS
ncbi:hypothetical protein C1646_671776 [Rhizophagus diaphanus]|nr:hypothetical protein C1646_671776 [Rhizophagus diaphanus] [Rhizophagus sp. MUCL 43196]